MLNRFLNDFKNYCVYLSLSDNSTKELIRYISQLNDWLKNNNINELSQLTYKQLLNFAISGEVGPTTVKARIWAMKKFFSFLLLHNHIKVNIALSLNPPKIPKKETRFLTENEMKIVFEYSAGQITQMLTARFVLGITGAKHKKLQRTILMAAFCVRLDAQVRELHTKITHNAYTYE